MSTEAIVVLIEFIVCTTFPASMLGTLAALWIHKRRGPHSWPTDVKCPTCKARRGAPCTGSNYGFHALRFEMSPGAVQSKYGGK